MDNILNSSKVKNNKREIITTNKFLVLFYKNFIELSKPSRWTNITELNHLDEKGEVIKCVLT